MAINYNPTQWQQGTIFNPTNCNNFENGIKAACDRLDELGNIDETVTNATVGNGGRNLINVTPFTYNAWASSYEPFNAELNKLNIGTYTLSCSVKILEVTRSGQGLYSYINILNPDDSTIAQTDGTFTPQSVNGIVDMKVTFTVNESNKGKLRVQLFHCGNHGVGSCGTVEYYDIQVEQGSIAHPYEPYFMSLRQLSERFKVVDATYSMTNPQGAIIDVSQILRDSGSIDCHIDGYKLISVTAGIEGNYNTRITLHYRIEDDDTVVYNGRVLDNFSSPNLKLCARYVYMKL